MARSKDLRNLSVEDWFAEIVRKSESPSKSVNTIRKTSYSARAGTNEDSAKGGTKVSANSSADLGTPQYTNKKKSIKRRVKASPPAPVMRN